MKKCFFFFILLLIYSSALAKPTPEIQIDEALLPPIEAKTFPVSVVRRSRSLRVYLFQNLGNEPIEKHSILLTIRKDEPALGLLVLKTYPEKNQFAAKRIKHYGATYALDPSDGIEAAIKIKDLPWTFSQKETLQDRKDLEEIEKATKDFDSELDSGLEVSPLVKKKPPTQKKRAPSQDESLTLNLNQLLTKEIEPLEKDYHWLGFQFGFIRDSALDGSSLYFTSFGLQYAYRIFSNYYLHDAHLQDAGSIALALFYTQVLNYESTSDVYTLIPIRISFRYHVFLSQSFSIYAYLGLLKHFVLSASQASDQAISQIASFQPALGVGAYFKFGPKWYLQFEGGLDSLGTALVLRF